MILKAINFAIGWLFVESSSTVTLAIAVSGIVDQSAGYGWPNLSAIAILTYIPVVVLFLTLNRFLMRGLLVEFMEQSF